MYILRDKILKVKWWFPRRQPIIDTDYQNSFAKFRKTQFNFCFRSKIAKTRAFTSGWAGTRLGRGPRGRVSPSPATICRPGELWLVEPRAGCWPLIGPGRASSPSASARTRCSPPAACPPQAASTSPSGPRWDNSHSCPIANCCDYPSFHFTCLFQTNLFRGT